MNSAKSTSQSLSPSGLTQAAIVIGSLPRWQAANLLSRIRAEDCVKVLDAVSKIDQVTSDQLTESLNKLKQDSSRWRQSESKAGADSSQKQAVEDRRKTPGTIGDRAANVFAAKPFDFLINTVPKVRQQLLENEHPKNVSLILASLPADVASICLAELDPSTRVSVIRRMCEQDEIDPTELNELNYLLKLRHQKLFRRTTRKSSGIRVAVELLSFVDAETQQSILSMLEQTEPELAQELEFSFFTLDDLIDLSDDDIKKILQQVDTSHWAPALKRASFTLQQKILDNLAPGPKKFLSQQIAELNQLDPVVEQQAQRKIIKEALALAR
jgi:flagellar motor switch protein FliG